VILAVALLAAARETPLGAVEVGGTTLPDAIEVAGHPLPLNGAAVLTRLVFKVYAAALYLPAPAHSVEEALKPDAPRAFVMHFLREVSREKLVAAMQQGFETNAGQEAARASTEIARLLEVVKSMKSGDRLTFTYDPESGSTVTMTDGTVARFPGRDFADAFLLLWLGPHPPRQDMKRALLAGGGDR